MAWSKKFLASALTLLSVVSVIYFFSFVSSNIFGLQVMYVTSESMEPVFSRGDMIIGTKTPQSITVGDIITFKAKWLDGEIVTHRVSRVVNDVEGGYHGVSLIRPVSRNAQIYTYGDNNLSEDPEPVTIADVQTEVVSVVPYVGYTLFREVIFFTLSLAMLFWGLSFFLELKASGKYLKHGSSSSKISPVWKQSSAKAVAPSVLEEFLR